MANDEKKLTAEEKAREKADAERAASSAEEQRKVASAQAAEGEQKARLAQEEREVEAEKGDQNRVIVREVPKKDIRGAVTANDPGPVEATGVIEEDGTFSQGQIINEPPAGLGGPSHPARAGGSRPTGEGEEYVEPGKELDLPAGFDFQSNHAQRRQRLLDLVEEMDPEDALYTLAGKVATAEMLIATPAVKNGGWLQVNTASAARNNKVVDIPSTVGPDGVLVPVAQDMEAPIQPVFNLAERLNR
jgi:hypothetical protein